MRKRRFSAEVRLFLNRAQKVAGQIHPQKNSSRRPSAGGIFERDFTAKKGEVSGFFILYYNETLADVFFLFRNSDGTLQVFNSF